MEIIAGTALRDCAGGSAAHERSYASHSAGLLLPGLPDRRLRRTGIFILKLAEARKNGTLERLRTTLNQQDLLILDEWGYVPVDRDGSELLFQVISDSYESRSLILTTNIEFSKWGGIFTDEQMAAAMIDRLVHHGHLIMFDGKSYRMQHALMRQTVPQNEEIVS